MTIYIDIFVRKYAKNAKNHWSKNSAKIKKLSNFDFKKLLKKTKTYDFLVFLPILTVKMNFNRKMHFWHFLIVEYQKMHF